MATYLKGVEPFIPDYQPFQPDFNFYANVLQTKQNQYDTNWKQLNEIYGKYFYADVLRPEDIKKKDELLNQIDFELRRVSGLDLSLQQNVDQAAQVFRPFYEDKVLMHDMAYTKNYKNKRAGAVSLKTSKDTEKFNSYWDEGVEYMDIMKDKYVNSTADESLTMWAPEYTPFVNAIKTYHDLANELGIEADVTRPEGKWMVRRRNGELIYEPLVNVFQAEYANNPGLQERYRVQAIVNRERSIKKEMAEKKVDRATAENTYLNAQSATINAYLKAAARNANRDVENKTNIVEKIEKDKKADNTSVYTNKYQKDMSNSLEYAKSVWSNILQTRENTETKPSSSGMTDQGNISSDISTDLKAFKIDQGTAMMLANQDIYRAADSYSKRKMLVDYAANPYYVLKMKNQYKLQQIAEKDRLERLKDLDKARLDSGLFKQNLITGEIEIDPATLETKQIDPTVYTTDPVTNIIAENYDINVTKYKEDAKPGLGIMADFLRNAAEQGVLSKSDFYNMLLTKDPMSDEEALDIVYDIPADFQKLLDEGVVSAPVTPRQAQAYYQVNPHVLNVTFEAGDTKWIDNQFSEKSMLNTAILHPENIGKLYDNVYKYAMDNRGNALVDNFLRNISATDLHAYAAFSKRYAEVREINGKALAKTLAGSGAFTGFELFKNSELREIIADGFYDKETLEKIDKGNFRVYAKRIIDDAIKEGLIDQTKITVFNQPLKVKGDRKRVYTYVDGKGGGNNLSKEDFDNIEKVYKKEADTRLKAKGITFNPTNQLITIKRVGKKGSKSMMGTHAAFLNSGKSEDAAIILEYERTVKEIKDDIAKEYVREVNKIVEYTKNPGPVIDQLYDRMEKEYASGAQNTRELVSFNPQMYNKGNAYGQNRIIGDVVPLAAYGADGTNLFVNAVNIIDDIDFETASEIANGSVVMLGQKPLEGELNATFNEGASFWDGKDVKYDKLALKGKKGLQILNDLYKIVGTKDAQGMMISIGGLSKGAFSRNSLAAIQIGNIDYKWLYDNYVKTSDGKDIGFLTADEARQISQNGISFVSDYDNLSSTDVIKTATMDEFEQILVSGGEVKYVDPFNSGYYEVKENQAIGQPHVVSGRFQYIDDDGVWRSAPISQPSDKYNLKELDKTMRALLSDRAARNEIKRKQLERKGIMVSEPPELD